MKVNFITYILQSMNDHMFYVGYTTNLKKRLEEHNSGKVKSTKDRSPLRVVYYEVCYNQADALLRGEMHIKPQNVKNVALDVLRHRLILNYRGEAEGISKDDIVKEIISKVKIP